MISPPYRQARAGGIGGTTGLVRLGGLWGSLAATMILCSVGGYWASEVAVVTVDGRAAQVGGEAKLGISCWWREGRGDSLDIGQQP